MQLVEAGGAGDWATKAQALGTGRTAKAVHTRWLRHTGVRAPRQNPFYVSVCAARALPPPAHPGSLYRCSKST